jgi:hypothetical protein
VRQCSGRWGSPEKRVDGKGKRKAVAHRHSKAAAESDSWRGRQRDPAAIGERGDGEGTTRQWKRVTEAALTGGGDDSVAQRQCGRLQLALALVAASGGRGCDRVRPLKKEGKREGEKKGG